MDEQTNIYGDITTSPTPQPKKPTLSALLAARIDDLARRQELQEQTNKRILSYLESQAQNKPIAPATIPATTGSDVAALLMAINQMNSNALTNAVTLFKTAWEMAPTQQAESTSDLGSMLGAVSALAPLMKNTPPQTPQTPQPEPIQTPQPEPPKDGKLGEVPKI